MGFLAVVCVLASVVAGVSLHAGIAPVWVMLGLSIALVLAVVAAGWHIDRRLAHPVVSLARGAETLTHTDAEHALEMPSRHWLGRLPDAVAAMDQALTRSEMELAKAATSWASDRDQQRRRLDTVLAHIGEGVILCEPRGGIQIYNRAARELLGDPPALSRGRALTEIIDAGPVRDALTAAEQRPPGARVVPFATKAVSGLRLRGVLVARADGDDDYLLILTEWCGHGAGPYAERALVRSRSRAVRAAAEAVGWDRYDPGRIGDSNAVATLITELHPLLELSESGAAADRAFPHLGLHRLLDAVERRTTAFGISRAGAERLRVRTDPGRLADALARLPEALDSSPLSMTGEATDAGIRLVIGTDMTTGDDTALAAWLDQAIATSDEPLTVQDCIAGHDGHLYWQQSDDGRVQLWLDLVGFRAAHPPPPKATAAFARSHRAGATRPIESLDCVVFDTETTGLDPSLGDAIVAIGALRVRNGEIMDDEVFDRLVDPQRPIPAAATRCHGITDDAVRGAPTIGPVLRDFHAFAGNAVLVAHNAAFDMRFIQRSESQAGVHFANPVLDTLLLSLLVHDHAREHSLEAIARRLGLAVTDRHAALGDARTTAAILTNLMPLLPPAGLRTLGDVERASQSLVEYQRQKRAF
jgi:DNA polymerase-3 subunit epsilon